ADRNRSHWSTSKTPSYTKSVSWQHHRLFAARDNSLFITELVPITRINQRNFDLNLPQNNRAS
ncbi:hypothetical protein, partial [Escherichia coli]|uniref:hypothetical protein n=1 Tax=Escherichia coli TaxID=562 RepID=UPI001BFE1B14